MGGSCLFQFLPVPVSVEDTDAVDPGVQGSLHVVLPVADHDGQSAVLFHAQAGQALLDDFRLAVASALHEAPRDDIKKGTDLKIIKDAQDVVLGLGGGDGQEISPILQILQHPADSGVQFVFKDTDLAKALSVKIHSPIGFFPAEVKIFHKGLDQGRADKAEQVPGIRGGDPQLFKGVLHRFYDSFPRFGQGAVQVK